MGPLHLDHVILLLPYAHLTNPPTWLTSNFTLSPGGRHADNKTENRLVLFRDGTYLELIAFINDDPALRKGHWWDKPFGVVDYAFTTTKLDHEGIVRRLEESGSAISYEKPKEGGRLRPDGVELKWEVTFPKGVERGNVPFFCTDVTPRERRVPVTEDNSTHPCGALGMAGVTVEVADGRLEGVSRAFAGVFDAKFREDGVYEGSAVNEVEGLKKPTIRFQATGDERDLALTWRVQTTKAETPGDISERIGDGLVSIRFERA